MLEIVSMQFVVAFGRICDLRIDFIGEWDVMFPLWDYFLDGVCLRDKLLLS
jgi:hypothetical protein